MFKRKLRNIVEQQLEIVEKIDNIGGFVSGIGTGGTLIGISRKLKEKNKDLKVIALEPDKMPLLKENRILGEHKIEGIGDDFIPKIVDRGLIDDIVLINDGAKSQTHHHCFQRISFLSASYSVLIT